MDRASNVAGLLVPNGPQDLGYRQGTMLAWNGLTGENSVDVAGTQLDNLPVVSSGTLALAVGDVVSLIRFRSTYMIMGRISAAGAGAMSPKSAYLPAQESTSSATYTDLATPGPVVQAYVGSSGTCLVMIQGGMGLAGPGYASMSFITAGATTLDTSYPTPAFLGTTGTSQTTGSQSSQTLMTGLNPGLHTFTAKYARLNPGTGASAATFNSRVMTVIPF